MRESRKSLADEHRRGRQIRVADDLVGIVKQVIRAIMREDAALEASRHLL